VWSERGVFDLGEESWIELSSDQDPWVRYVAERRLAVVQEHTGASGDSDTGWSTRMAKSILGYRLSLVDGLLKRLHARSVRTAPVGFCI